MIGGPYSPLKVFHHQGRIEQLKHREPIVPTQVQLFISDLCNFRCRWCAYRWKGYESNQLFAEMRPDGTVNNNPNRMIPYGKVIEILDDCASMGVGAIQITGGGESLVHPKHCEIYEAVLSRGLELGLVTNGSRLHERECDILTQPGCKWVRVSIDAATAETYSQTRRIPTQYYHHVLENVKRLVRLKGDNTDPIIGIGFVVTKDNWHEVVRATLLARELGVDNIRLSAVFQPDDEAYFKGFHGAAAELCRQAKEYETDRFKVFNLFGDRLEDLTVHSPDYAFCGYQHFNTLIGASLDIYRCCNLAYNRRGYLSTLENRRFRDAWLSDELQAKLWGFDAQSCQRCMFNRKNQTILYAMDEDPEHVNFV